jgi:hypothetical protein
MAFIASVPGWAGVIDDDTARTPAPALRCSVRRDGWQIEPQSQLIYQGFDFSSLNCGAANVSFSDLASLDWRICGRLSRLWEMENKPLRRAAHGIGLGRRQSLARISRPAGHQFSVRRWPRSVYRESAGQLGRDRPRRQCPGVGTRRLFGSVDYASTFAGDTHAYGEKVGLRVNW